MRDGIHLIGLPLVNVFFFKVKRRFYKKKIMNNIYFEVNLLHLKDDF